MSARTTDVLNAIEGLRESNDVALAKQEKTIADLQNRLEEMESKAGSPGRTVPNDATREQVEHKKLFENWLRNPDSHHPKNSSR